MFKKYSITSIGNIVELFEKYPVLKSKIEVKSDTGFFKILEARKTYYGKYYTIYDKNKNSIICSPDHIFIDDNLQEIKAKKLTIESKISSTDGFRSVSDIEISEDSRSLYDIEVDEVHRYYTNGFLSHNSLLIESIVFAVFGRTIRGQSVDKIINKQNKKELYVELEIDNLKIIRKRKPNSLELYSEDKGNETLSTVSLTQKLIEDKIGVNYETFINILCYGQHNMFDFLSASAPAKRAIIENLLSLEDYNKYESVARKTSNTLKKEMARLSGKYETILENESKNKEQLDSYKKKFLDFVSEKRLEIEKLESKIEKFKNIDIDEELKKFEESEQKLKKINKINEEYQNTVHDLDKTNKRFKEYELKFNNFQHDIQKELKYLKIKIENILSIDIDLRLEEWNIYEKKLKDLTKAQQELNEISLNISNIEKNLIPIINEIKQIDENLSKIKNIELGVRCPSCLQIVDPDNAKNTEKDFSEMREELSEQLSDPQKELQKFYDLKKQLSSKHKELSKIKEPEIKKEVLIRHQSDKEHLNSQLKEKEERLNENPYDDIINKINVEILQLSEKIDNIKKEIDKEQSEFNKYADFKKSKFDKEELIKFKAQKDHTNELLESKKSELKNNTYEDVIKNIEKEIKEISSNIKSLKKEMQTKEDLTPYLDFWIHGFSDTGIKSYIINQIIPALNSQVNYWLQFLYNNRLEIEFDQYLDAKIFSYDEEFDYKGSSGGEKRRIDLAILLSFAHIMRLSSKADNNILFLDESTESLDKNGVECMYQTILELSRERTVFVITHHPYLLEKFENRQKLIVIKENRFSKFHTE
jgi:DNA repair exonuclease SbcCD ATPase subunit